MIGSLLTYGVDFFRDKSQTRFGHVEVRCVTELIGLLLIFAGFRANVREQTSLLSFLTHGAATGSVSV